MTDHDRGAYTPQSDAPLAFDARAPRDSRPLPMTLIASGVVLLVIVGALFLAYRGGVRGAGDQPRPVGEPVGAIKTAAGPAAQQPQDPAANLDVYAAQNVPDVKPTFAPAPEQPAARPAPAQLQVHTVAPAPVRIEPSQPAVASTAGARTSIAPVSPPRPAASIPVAAPPAATSSPAEVEQIPRGVAPARPRPTPAAPAPAQIASQAAAPAPAIKPSPALAAAASGGAASGGAAVQIGAFSSRALADKGFADVSGAMAGRMAGHGQHVEPLAHDGKTVFRTTVTGFADKASAKAFCTALTAKGHTCFVKG